MPTPAPPTDEPEPIGGPASDRWWWAGVVRAVGGSGIVAYQVPVLQDGAITLNWVMVVLGVALAGWGLVRLWQDHTTHQAVLAARIDADGSPDRQA